MPLQSNAGAYNLAGRRRTAERVPTCQATKQPLKERLDGLPGPGAYNLPGVAVTPLACQVCCQDSAK